MSYRFPESFQFDIEEVKPNIIKLLQENCDYELPFPKLQDIEILALYNPNLKYRIEELLK